MRFFDGEHPVRESSVGCFSMKNSHRKKVPDKEVAVFEGMRFETVDVLFKTVDVSGDERFRGK